MLGVLVLRNQHLENTFYRLNLIEAYGTGIPKIFGVYDEFKAKPIIEVSDNAFKLTLPNVNCYSSPVSTKPFIFLSDRENLMMHLFDQNEFVQRKAVEPALNISQQTSVLLLRTMVEKDLIKKVGKGKLVKYTRARLNSCRPLLTIKRC